MAALDIYEREQRGAIQRAARSPASAPPPSFGEIFDAALQADIGTARSYSASKRRFDVVQGFLDQYYEKTGESLPNPESVEPELRGNAYDAIRKRFDDAREQKDDFDLTLPGNEDIERLALERGRELIATQADVDARSSGFVDGVASFTGTMVGAMTDPINIVTMMFGAGPSAGVARTALTEGGLALGSETVIQGAIFQDRRELDPNHGVLDAANEVLAAGVGGAVLGGGIKALANGAARIFPSADRATKDAANVVQRDATKASTPFKTSGGEVAHRASVQKAAEDTIASKPVKLPKEAFIEGAARPGRLYTADGQNIGVQYDIVEARTLTTSHNDDFSVNEAFPGELQPRERARAISQDQIGSMARNLQPERLGPSVQAENGAPVIGPDDIVESGNARVMAIRKAYEDGGVSAENYRNFLRAQGHDIDGMSQPVLIARRVTALEQAQREAFVVGANRPSTLRLSATEQALADARHIDTGMLAKIEGGDLGTAENRGFVRGFMQKLPRSEQGSLIDKNRVLSQEGLRRVNAAVMARAYGDATLLARVLEDPDSNVRAIGGALQDAAPAWAKLRDAVVEGAIPANMDITDDLLDAIRLITRARDEGAKFSDVLHQAEMFGGPSETGKLLGRFMFKNGDLARPVSRKAMSEMLQDFAAEAQKNLAGERLIGEPLGTGDVLQTTLKRAGRDDLATIADQKLTDDAIEKMADDPAVDDQVTLEAERMVAESLTGSERVIDRKSLVGDAGINDEIDAKAISDKVRSDVADELERGNLVEFVSEGKPHRIVKVDKLGMRDEDGNPWGVIPLLATDAKNPDFIRIASRDGTSDLEIPLEDGSTRKLSDLLDEADEEAAAANEIEVCVTGPTREAAQ